MYGNAIKLQDGYQPFLRLMRGVMAISFGFFYTVQLFQPPVDFVK